MKKIIPALAAQLFIFVFALPIFASAATVNINVADDSFSPKNVTINQDDTVVWTNAGSMAHTVTADGNTFDSGNLAPGQSFSQTFSGAGTLAYHCKYHWGAGGVGMAGTVVVQAGAQVTVNNPTQASGNADLQAQAQALLQQVAQLQAQLAAQGGGSGATVTTGTASNSTAPYDGNVARQNAGSSCPNIGRVLKLGSSGDDVSRLQQFLAQDPSIYPEGKVTGYFGALTQAAVQRWQAAHNIVSSGTPGTTGYGLVGPRTAAAIALLCSTGASAPVGGYIQVSPISGNAPLNVNVVATVNSTNSCAGAIYQLNWGDGSNGISIPVSANNCQPLSQTYQHQYTIGGTYQITLSSGAHQTGATITVYGNSNGTGTGVGTSGGTGQSETFTATPTSGSAPLTVAFSGIVTGADQGWCSSGCSDILVLGDGTQAAVPLPTSQTGIQSYSLQHTYTSGGSFTSVLYQGQAGNGRPVVGTPITINVSGGSGAQGSTSSLNPPTVTPAYGGNPLAVSLSFDMPSCTSYQVSWGDSGAAPGTSQCGTGTIPAQTVQHTYMTGGQYTITLTRGSRVDTTAVNISN